MKIEYTYGNYPDEALMLIDTDDHYYAHNHLYSPVALMEDDGDVVERYEYDVYGKPYFYNSTLTALLDPQKSTQNNPIAFTGQRFDRLDSGDLQLMYYKNRYYNPTTGRFLQRDPLGHVGGMNLYEYVSSNSVMLVDAYGFMPTLFPQKPTDDDVFPYSCAGSQTFERIPGCRKWQPLFYNHHDQPCKRGLGCLKNALIYMNLVRNFVGRYAFGLWCYGGFDAGHRGAIDHIIEKMNDCGPILRDECRCEPPKMPPICIPTNDVEFDWDRHREISPEPIPIYKHYIEPLPYLPPVIPPIKNPRPTLRRPYECPVPWYIEIFSGRHVPVIDWAVEQNELHPVMFPLKCGVAVGTACSGYGALRASGSLVKCASEAGKLAIAP